jgi:cell volume regulation protein A
MAGVESADVVFDVVFFVVLTSVLLQGSTIAPVARWLGLDEKDAAVPDALGRRGESDLVSIDPGPTVTGKRIVELELPAGTLIILIYREGSYFVPQGATRIGEGDRLMIFTSKQSIDAVRALLAAEG